MHVAFEAPIWLWLLAAVLPAVWLIARQGSPAPGAGARRVIALGLRALLVAGLAVALARPALVRDVPAVSAVALFDVSASISDAGLAQERGLAAALARAATPPHDLRVVRFAAAARVLDAGERPEDLARASGDEALGTDIARALGLAAGLGDPRRTRRLVLVSDGRATAGDALGEAGRLAAAGTRIDVVRLASAVRAGDVAVVSLSAPGEVRPRAPFPLDVRLAADRPTRVCLTLRKDGAPAAEGVRAIDLPAGETTVTWETRLGEPGTSVYQAEVRRASDAATCGGDGVAAGIARAIAPDAAPGNDRGLLAIATEPPPRVLLLSPAPDEAAPLTRALRAEDIDVDTRALGGGGRRIDPAELGRFDLVVLADVPRASLAAAGTTSATPGAGKGGGLEAALEAYVRDGGGLLVTGGPHAFGPGGWQASRLAEMLPVGLELPQRQDEPVLALALVIDRSGSMAGPRMELTKQAARATAEMLPPDDQIAVIAFDKDATTVVPMQRAANRLRIATDIGRIVPNGGTNILAGLREAVEQLGAARAKKKHAILLSDGQSGTDGIVELVDAAAGSRITFSAVGVGEGVDESLLQAIAEHGGGRYYHTRDPAGIPRIFTREASEVAAGGIVQRPTPVVERKHTSMLDGLGLGGGGEGTGSARASSGAPPLGGYVRTHARAQADLLLASADGDPLLARWSVGLGQVVAWTSDLGSRWADRWARWPPFVKLWGQVARATMREHAARRFPLTARLDGGDVEVSVEGVGDDDRFLAGLEGTVEITDVSPGDRTARSPDPARVISRRLPLPETAPGRYEARFPVAATGETAMAGRPAAILLRALLSHDGHPVASASGHLSVPLAPELLPAAEGNGAGARPAGSDLLAAIAARTGGGFLGSPADLFAGAPPRRSSRPLRAPLLLAMAALLVADVALRRLGARGGKARTRTEIRSTTEKTS